VEAEVPKLIVEAPDGKENGCEAGCSVGAASSFFGKALPNPPKPVGAGEGAGEPKAGDADVRGAPNRGLFSDIPALKVNAGFSLVPFVFASGGAVKLNAGTLGASVVAGAEAGAGSLKPPKGTLASVIAIEGLRTVGGDSVISIVSSRSWGTALAGVTDGCLAAFSVASTFGGSVAGAETPNLNPEETPLPKRGIVGASALSDFLSPPFVAGVWSAVG